MNIDRLIGKVVLVTGAGSGLGEATAHAFASVGCSVACIDINGTEAGRVSNNLISHDVMSIAVQCDVGEATAVVHTVQMVHEQFKQLDQPVEKVLYKAHQQEGMHSLSLRGQAEQICEHIDT